jgi:hypothetical protein
MKCQACGALITMCPYCSAVNTTRGAVGPLPFNDALQGTMQGVVWTCGACAQKWTETLAQFTSRESLPNPTTPTGPR